MGPAGAAAIAPVLAANPGLDWVNFGTNELGDAGAMLIAGVLTRHPISLQVKFLGNKISYQCINILMGYQISSKLRFTLPQVVPPSSAPASISSSSLAQVPPVPVLGTAPSRSSSSSSSASISSSLAQASTAPVVRAAPSSSSSSSSSASISSSSLVQVPSVSLLRNAPIYGNSGSLAQASATPVVRAAPSSSSLSRAFISESNNSSSQVRGMELDTAVALLEMRKDNHVGAKRYERERKKGDYDSDKRQCADDKQRHIRLSKKT